MTSKSISAANCSGNQMAMGSLSLGTGTAGNRRSKGSNNNNINRSEASSPTKGAVKVMAREREVPTKQSSPVKAATASASARPGHGHNKTPSRSNSNSNSITNTAVSILSGGIGRMDIAAQDWDGTATATATSPLKKRTTSVKQYDRFIPSRENSAGTIENNKNASGKKNTAAATADDESFDEGESKASESAEGHSFGDSPPPSTTNQEASSDQAHTAELSSSLGIDLGRRILSFSAEPPPASNEHSSLLAAYARGETGRNGTANSAHTSALAASQRRRIATTPDRVLDAPGLVDDYYLNLLDWSSTNLLAIALAESVYIWNGDTGDVGCLCSINPNSSSEQQETEDIVCSVKFSDDGSYLAIGTSTGTIQIYDLSTSTRIRTMAGHATRVPSLSWSGAILSSGSRDGSIWNSDVRVAQHKVGEMRGHRAEVCGLEWRKDTGLGSSVGTNSAGGGMGLLASGGNDNIVNVWDGRMLNAPKMVKSNHTAAVKAIAWCPWQSSLLATGGGSSDRTIHFWNTTTSARLNSLVTPSQVTSLRFNPHSREVLSSHGFPDHNLSIWTYPTLTKVIDIPQAHETRILHTCLNPDGTTLATASSDENLKFWKVFELPKKTGSGALSGSVGPSKESKSGDEMGRRGRTGIAIR